MAPRMGVMRPISAYMQVTKNTLKQKSCMEFIFFLSENSRQMTANAIRKIFSTADNMTNTDPESQSVGRTITRTTAEGACEIRLMAVGSMGGISILLLACVIPASTLKFCCL